MPLLFASNVLTAGGWLRDVRLTIAGGRISDIAEGVEPGPGDERVALLLPGMPNLHSHAFQRGMAGLTEIRGSMADSFWTWREAMYRYALTMAPEQMEAIAAQLYVEMLEAGFTRIGEFHYLHHDPAGKPYADIAEMAARICAAASSAGIGLTLLPAFYAHGNFGGQAPHAGQRRFLNGIDDFARLLDASKVHAAKLDRAKVGVAPHSLRAVTPDELSAVARLGQGGPIHIHAAEQIKEVEDSLAWSGRRPVEWLLENVAVNERWCLIHATHMTSAETLALAKSGAVAGLCPVTEANLGDGIFNGAEYVPAGGRFGVGSDSNILIGITDELRQLETTQRLRDRQRNVLALAGGSTGEALFQRAVAGGAQALDGGIAGIAIGAAADFVSLDLDHPSFAGRARSDVLDTWIFGGVRAVDCVWVAGRKRVVAGCHHDRDRIANRFRITMRELAAA